MTAPEPLVERLAGATREAVIDWNTLGKTKMGNDVSMWIAEALLPVVEQEIAAARAEGRALGRYEMTVGHKPDPRDPNYQAGYGRGRAEVGERIAQAIEAVAADPERTRPLAPDAEVATDFANDFQWAARIARTAAQAATSPEEER